ncbi:hypothetical protein PVK06_045906 [Gossypium arboreum]|uniref:Uncharacterized protein n=1 Tax=Gossypium arboreum TaxID=29729 RepID=A0ABR0MVB5_GOSAR|nr:hypothetical protein PVK06_045906 [Gossypium arboreum]
MSSTSSSDISKRKRKNVQESVVDEQVKFMGEQLGKIANALEQFTADKTPQLYEQVMSMEEEGFHDDFLCSVFDYLSLCSYCWDVGVVVGNLSMIVFDGD